MDKIFDEKDFDSSPFGPPESRGVYAICVNHRCNTLNQGKVVYIGSSNNVYKRVLNTRHIYRRLFNILKNYCVYTMVMECENHIEIEKNLVRKYKPRFNRELYGS